MIAPYPSRPAPVPPALDRSTSTRTPQTPSRNQAASDDAIPTRSISQRDPSSRPYQARKTPSPASSSPALTQPGPAFSPNNPYIVPQDNIATSTAIPPSTPVGSKEQLSRDRSERRVQAPSGASAQQLAKMTGTATPRRREKKDKANDIDIVKRLQAICTDADPTRLYRSLVKIGQGYVILRSQFLVPAALAFLRESPFRVLRSP